jgi:hypothetical protein
METKQIKAEDDEDAADEAARQHLLNLIRGADKEGRLT